jgi:hypothetical protein
MLRPEYTIVPDDMEPKSLHDVSNQYGRYMSHAYLRSTRLSKHSPTMTTLRTVTLGRVFYKGSPPYRIVVDELRDQLIMLRSNYFTEWEYGGDYEDCPSFVVDPVSIPLFEERPQVVAVYLRELDDLEGRSHTKKPSYRVMEYTEWSNERLDIGDVTCGCSPPDANDAQGDDETEGTEGHG